MQRHWKKESAFLRDSGSPTARLDAEVLLAHTLEFRRVDLYGYPERLLTVEEERTYRSYLERRAQRELVSYIRGCKEFFGLTLAVARRVLVPRPETEVLVERALECAAALARDDRALPTSAQAVAVLRSPWRPACRGRTSMPPTSRPRRWNWPARK